MSTRAQQQDEHDSVVLELAVARGVMAEQIAGHDADLREVRAALIENTDAITELRVHQEKTSGELRAAFEKAHGEIRADLTAIATRVGLHASLGNVAGGALISLLGALLFFFITH